MPVFNVYLTYQPPGEAHAQPHPGSPFLIVAGSKALAADACVEAHFDERLRAAGCHPIAEAHLVLTPRTERALVVSTAHMPRASALFGPAWSGDTQPRLLHDGDTFVLVLGGGHDSALDAYPDTPEWLLPLLEYAMWSGCSYLVFDMDAEELEPFQTWDW